MPNDDRYTPTIEYIVELLEANADELGLASVFYGDQNLIGDTPSVAVEPGPFSRTLNGRGGKGRTENNIRVFLMVFVARLEGKSAIRRECDLLAEAIMDLLHKDVSMGGHVIHGFVTGIDPGYATRGKKMVVSRISWEGMTSTTIV